MPTLCPSFFSQSFSSPPPPPLVEHPLYFFTSAFFIIADDRNMELLTSPSFHHISPLTRSRSDVRSSAMKRGLRKMSNKKKVFQIQLVLRRVPLHLGQPILSSRLRIWRWLHEDLSSGDLWPPPRSPRLHHSTMLEFNAALHTTLTSKVYSRHSGIRDIGTKRWLEGKLNAYNTSLFTRPDYQKRVEKPIASTRSYVRYMPVDDALDMYKKRCMTVGTLSKYWLSPATWASRREKELNLSSSLSRGNYSYSSRFDRLGGRVY
ncbi:Protein CBG14241 [Caenorhabditis briggsae]|uniref:Protein CBG14241 n=1 Tax=Caenorhabditis briggsae TaxID=6238 RepID=A8XJK9_CAEBR|nr:Protein CBG14241 [Caenorhabditis briggsae]CAP32835.2 Protein CBG14241 [Caenorhabditis briggsae]